MMPSSDEWLPPRMETPGNGGNEWQSHLIRMKSARGQGEPKSVLANAVIALRLCPDLQGVIAYDEFSLSLVIRRKTVLGDRVGGEWTDHEERLFADWLHHHQIFVSVEVAGQAAQVVAREQSFHPVRDYLDGLGWDGTKRIDGWLNLYLGAAPSDYSSAVGARWLRSAVARVKQPGCKADCVLILEGKQGLKKSTAIRILGQPWYTDDIADLGSKDAALQARGVFILEIAELEGMKKPDMAKVKAFVSRAVDRFRPPYGRYLIESPRQCVFAGSVNHWTYLQDETGARRFWPVACTRILTEELERDRDQLWAEAVATYKSGTSWWLDTPELNAAAEFEQAQRYEEGAWDDLVSTWCSTQIGAGETSVSVAEILEGCLKKRPCDWTRNDQMAVARVLRAMKWERFRLRITGDPVLKWRYRPVPNAPLGTGHVGNEDGNIATD